jgi:hypothetical protein
MKNLFTKTILKKGIRTCLVTITFMLLAFGLKAQVSVTATAGTAGPTAYTTLNAAFTAINAGTHQGAISIAITGNTTEPATPVQLLASGGAVSYTSINIAPSGGNFIIGSSTTPAAQRGLIELFGADNVTIDGDDPGIAGDRNLTFQMNNTAAVASSCIRLMSTAASAGTGCTNVTIKNCNLIGGRISNVDATVTMGVSLASLSTTSMTGGGYDHENFTFDNNYVIRAYYGLYIVGVTGGTHGNCVVKNNILGNTAGINQKIGFMGIFSSYTANNATAGNSVIGRAIYSNNDITVGYQTNASGGIAWGTNMYGIDLTTGNAGAIVERNNIHDIYQPSSGGWAANGIGIISATNNDSICINNNFIRDMATNRYTTGTIYGGYGIYISSGNYSKINHNTIVLNTPPANEMTATALNTACIMVNSTTAIISELKNNILQNNTASTTNIAGLTVNAYNFYSTAASIATTLPSYATSNYNNFFGDAPASGTTNLRSVAFATAAARTTLTDWQTISGKDVNSKSLASGFTSTSDLHINIANPDAVNVSDAAPPVAGVTNDIDNETRSLSLVDIGADEFILTTCGTVTTPTIATSTYNKCVGQTQTLTATNVTAGAGMVYEWQSSATPGGPYSPVAGGTGANTPIYTTPVLSAGTTYYVLVTTCTVSTLAETSNEVTMVVNTLPNVSVTTSNASYCAGNPVTLTAASTDPIAPIFTWLPATVTPTSGAVVSASPTGNTTYTVLATDANTCTSTATIVENYFTSPTLSNISAIPASICSNSTSQLNINTSCLNSIRISEITQFRSGTGATNPYPSIFGTADYDFCELTNATSDPIDLSGLNYQGWSTGGTSPLRDYTFPAGVIIAPNSALVLVFGTGTNDAAQQVYFDGLSASGPYSSSTPTGHLIKFAGSFIDVVGTNSFVWPVASGVTASDWSGNIATSSAGVIRTATSDNNLASDWTVASAALLQTIGTYNSGYSFPSCTFTYDWQPSTEISGSSPNTISNPIAAPIQSTVYTVTVTSSNGCTSSSTALVNVAGANGPFSLNAPSILPSSGIICSGQNLTIKDTSVNGGGPFVWNIEGPTTGNFVYSTSAPYNNDFISFSSTTLASGTYTVNATDACNNFGTQTFSILVNPTPIASITSASNNFCTPGSPVVLTGSNTSGTAPFVSAWAPSTGLSSTNTAITNATPSSSTIYTYTVSDVNGCTATATTTITPVVGISFSGVVANPAAVCLGGTSTLTATVPSAANTYCIPTTTNGCGAGDHITNVSFNTIANATGACVSGGSYSDYTTTSTSLVAGSTYPLSVSVNNGGTEYASAWIDYNNNGTFESTEFIPITVTASTTWDGTASVTIPTSAYNGTTRLRVRSSYNAAITAASACSTYSYGETEDYNITISGGVDPLTYAWSPSSSIVPSNLASGVVANINATQTYTVTATAGNGCTAVSSVSIIAGTALTCDPITSSLGSSFCGNFSSVLTANPIGGGAPYTYQWSNASGNLGTAATQSASITGSYSVVVTDNCGQSCMTSISLIVNAIPTVAANSTSSLVCSSGSVTISATGADTYAWMPGTLSGSSINPSITASTIYTVTGTDLNGCTATSTAAVSFDNNPTFTSIAASPVSVCLNGTSTITASAQVGGLISGGATAAGVLPADNCNPSYSSGSGFGDFIQAVSGLITNTTGASASPYVTSFSNTPPTLNFGTTYTLNVTPGTWSSNDVAVFIDFNRNGILTDAGEKIGEFDNTGAGAVSAFVINIPVSANSGLARLRVVEADQSTTGGMLPCTAYAYGETEDYIVNIVNIQSVPVSSYSWNASPSLNTTIGSAVIASNIGASETYTVTAATALGCTATSTVEVTIAGAVSCSAITSSLGAAFCAGFTSTLTANHVGGGAPYNYQWSDASGNLGTAATQAIATSGTYSVVVTDNCGQTCVTSIAIIVNTLPTVTASTTNTLVCFSGSASITADGAISYAWMPGSLTGANINPSITANTTFTVTGTDANGCTNTATKSVLFDNFNTTAVSSATSPICVGGTSTISVSDIVPGPTTLPTNYCASSAQFSGDEEIYNFSFNGGSTPAAYAGVNACSTVAPGAGSALDLYSNFTGSLLTTVSTGNTYTYNLVENECNGATFYDFGTAIFVDWNRDGDFNDVDETVLQEASTIIGPRNISGSITVPATATPGYTRMRIMVIESTSGTSLTPCFFGGYGEVEDYTINITSPTTTNSYLWSDPTASTAYSVAVSPATSTTYTVTSTSALGCTTTTTVTVNVAIPAVAASATPATVQLGQTSTLAGTGAATYAWSPSTNLSAANGSSVIATPTALGTLTYAVIGTDANGCTGSGTVALTTVPAVSISLLTNDASCFGQASGTIDVDPIGFTGTVNYSINPSAGSTGGLYTYTNLPAGTYTISATDGTSSTSAVTTISQPATAISAMVTTTGPLCNGDSSGSFNVVGAGGTNFPAGYNYLYTLYDASSNVVAFDSFSAAFPSGSYTMAVEDYNGCIYNAPVTIANTPLLTMSAASTNISCFNLVNGAITVTATGGTGTKLYQLNSSAYQSANTFTSLAAGIYTITTKDANNCTTSATATIIEPSAVTISATAGTILCNGGTADVTLTTNGGTGTIATTPANTGLTAGTYTFTATDANGCSATSVATIAPAPSAVTISATAGTILCNGGTANVTLLTGGGTGTITTAPAANNLLGGTYVFTATDANGCTAAASATIINPSLLTATVAANSTSIATGGTLVLTTTPAGLASYNVAGPSISNTGTSNVFSTTVTPANSGVYTISVANTNGCAASTTITITVFAGSKVAIKTMLSGPYDASTGLMWDSLRVKGLIPSTEPYSTAPYNTTYMHVNGGGGETVAPSVLAVTGSNAIVDWVFVQLRSKLDSNIVVATRSALIQRDGDVVDIDGISPVLFANSIPDNYFISIEHRNHLGIMTKGKYALSGAVSTMDLTTNAIPLFAFAGRAGNPAPFTGPTRKIGSVRALYAGNCNIDLALSAYRYITYNASTGGDKTQLFSVTGFGVNTLTGYSLYDCDLNGYARFNGLSPDRLVIYLNCGNSNTNIVNEQTPN